MNSGCQKEHWKVHKTEHRKIEKALNAVQNEGEKEDDTKSGSTNKTSSPTIQSKPIQKEKDECPICLDVLSFDESKFERFCCCGKGIHNHCVEQLDDVKSKNIREYCPLCRTKRATTQEENIKRVQKWVKKKKAWAQFGLGTKYFHGECGVKEDVKRAFVLYTLAADQDYAAAQCNLGVMYEHGKALRIFRSYLGNLCRGPVPPRGKEALRISWNEFQLQVTTRHRRTRSACILDYLATCFKAPSETFVIV